MNYVKLLSYGILSSFIGLFFTGCVQSGYKQFYSQESPKKYPETKNVMIFEYSNIKLSDIQTILFDDYLVVGKSGFEGPYEKPDSAVSFAKSIGADILLTNTQFKEKRNSIVPITLPSQTTTNFSGYSGGSSFYGSATSYGTKTSMIPITVSRYTQHGIFLKNINNVHPLWERTIKDYKKTSENDLEGLWENENYKLDVFQSGQQIVAFINNVKATDDRQDFWKQNNLKFIFGVETKKGIYLMGDKTPIPSNFKVNKFGFLEIELITDGSKFSFEKIK
mgnify:CR=1 FL=1